MPTLFRRKSTDLLPSTEPEAVEEPARSKNYTPSKRELGVPTPKRTGTVRRSGAPVTRTKEETKEARKIAASDRAKQRAAMMEGEEWALNARDKGPQKRLVRDIVDSRRNLAEYGLYVVIAFMIMSFFSAHNPAASLYLEGFLLLCVLFVVTDTILLRRRISRVVTEKMPKASLAGLARYGMGRSMQIRRMRIPKPLVERGQDI